MRRLLVVFRRSAGGGCFLLAICALWFAAHLWRIGDGPTGFHEWREADTCTVAWNLHQERFDLLHPRISVRGDGDGVVGQEFPLLNAAIALGWRLFGDEQHWWPRLLAVMSGLALIIGVRPLALDLRLPRAAAGFAALALACSPLLFFYGRKITPDLPAAALALWGAVLARRWVVGAGGWRSALGGAVLLATAGLMKPLALCVGLPLAITLLQHHGWRALAKPRWWVFAAICIVPMVAWFRHAQGLGHSGYFLLGVPWQRSFDAIIAGKALKRLLIEWPWQLWIGLALAPAFAPGCWFLVRGGTPWIWWWMIGAFAVLLPFAGQFGPHDYYAVTMITPCAVITGAGLAWGIARRRRWMAGTTLILMLVAGPTAFLRVDHRYGDPYDHRAIRAAAALSIPREALVVAYDSVPATLLYRLARNGWSLGARSELSQLPALAARGARFVAARGERRRHLNGLVGPALWTVEDLSVFPIQRP